MNRFFRPITRSLAALACVLVFAPAAHSQSAARPKVAAPSRPAASALAQKKGAPVLNAAARINPAAIIQKNPAAAQSLRLPAVYAPTRPRVASPRYPWKNNIVTTIFWIGEPSTGVTAACNTKSSWDTQWEISYGGFDNPDPSTRKWDFSPKAFTPRQNPFYIALPFNDMTNKGVASTVIPWHAEHPNSAKGRTVLKGRWLAIRFGKKICYAQWEDVGPFETDDWPYVFGKNAQPKTVMNNGVGLDVSPAVRDYLGIVSGVRCDWRFCDISEVPDGPWRKFGDNNPFVNSKDKELAERIVRVAELEQQRQEWLQNSYKPSGGF